MKTKLLLITTMILQVVLTISSSEVCFFCLHQPKVPENLNKFSKIK
ncbi:MAG: cyclic lactone autoinducer peptide [Lachnospiraceae bacterium]|nr:cyclic lactone autoinducer peptide [Lachnospiraceae bacterium]